MRFYYFCTKTANYFSLEKIEGLFVFAAECLEQWLSIILTSWRTRYQLRNERRTLHGKSKQYAKLVTSLVSVFFFSLVTSLVYVFFFFFFFSFIKSSMPGKGFCAKNMAVIIAMSDILQFQDGHRIRFYKFPKIKNSAKNRS